ncbi:hypothetical protein N0V87_008501, partial [Didymella glomerata]
EEAEEAEQEEADTSIPAPKQRGRSKKPQSATDEAEPLTTDLSIETPQPAKKKRGRPSKKDKAAEATPQKDTPTRATRSSAPKTRSEAFQALASESPAASKPKAKGKGKGKK